MKIQYKQIKIEKITCLDEFNLNFSQIYIVKLEKTYLLLENRTILE